MATDSQNKYSEQHILNKSFDEDSQTLVTIATSYNYATELGKNAAGDVVRIRKTVNGVTYEKTIENADMVVASTQTISALSKI